MDVVLKFPLKINTKLFCSCTGQDTCPVCQGYAGMLPLLNREALKCAIIVATDLECKLNMAHFFRIPAYADKTVGYIRSMQPAPLGTDGKYGVKRVYLEEQAIMHDGTVCGGAALICISFYRPDTSSLESVINILGQKDMVSFPPFISFYDAQRNISIIDPKYQDVKMLPEHLRDLPFTNGIYTPDGFFDAALYPIEPELDMCLVHIDPYTVEQVILGNDIPQGPLGI